MVPITAATVLGFPVILNGLMTSSSYLVTVDVGGSVGDVLATGTGRIGRVNANSDGDKRSGVFQGIKGIIYGAAGIDTVDVGDGLLSLGQGICRRRAFSRASTS